MALATGPFTVCVLLEQMEMLLSRRTGWQLKLAAASPHPLKVFPHGANRTCRLTSPLGLCVHRRELRFVANWK